MRVGIAMDHGGFDLKGEGMLTFALGWPGGK
jgi:hypothetical protein